MARGSDEGRPDAAPLLGADRDVLQVRVGARETPRRRRGLVEGRVQAAGLGVDQLGEGVEVGALQLGELAPLLDFTGPTTAASTTPATPASTAPAAADSNWYLRVFDPGQHLRGSDDVAALCAANEPLARRLLATAWSDPTFVSSYARWTVDILEGQRHYHYRIASKHHALRHRVHVVNSALFGLTALGALLHLALHTLWLSLVTTFFPALGASLHGALAQSEAYRLGTTSERLVAELQGSIDRIRAALDDGGSTSGVTALKAAIEAAIALILEEHQDWHLLVRPHNLPLA